MFGETARLGDGFELPVDVLGIALFSNANAAYDYDVMLQINSVDDAMVAKLMLPIAGQRATQR